MTSDRLRYDISFIPDRYAIGDYCRLDRLIIDLETFGIGSGSGRTMIGFGKSYDRVREEMTQ
jgi:hypothetical protein